MYERTNEFVCENICEIKYLFIYENVCVKKQCGQVCKKKNYVRDCVYEKKKARACVEVIENCMLTNACVRDKDA